MLPMVDVRLDPPTIAAGVLLWLLCAIVAAVVAENKRRSYGRWLLAGVVLGPLAVLWVSRLDEAIPPADRRECPKCGKTISRRWQRCKHCQAWVATDGSVDRAAQAGYVAGRLFKRFRHTQARVRQQMRRE